VRAMRRGMDAWVCWCVGGYIYRYIDRYINMCVGVWVSYVCVFYVCIARAAAMQ
jgi:hypothetical protein